MAEEERRAELSDDQKRLLENLEPGALWWGVVQTPDNIDRYNNLLTTLFTEDFLRMKPDLFRSSPDIPPPEVQSYLATLTPLEASWYLELNIALPPRFLLQHGIHIHIG